ncbi:tetratricopeptide repeat protein [Streptomyces sp. HMX112]|uniref:serine/threonine-protein kinase n=1 Tax=Streptomyces sp. HMX112 TaxID=3390850 RepID=UPI003A7F7190
MGGGELYRDHCGLPPVVPPVGAAPAGRREPGAGLVASPPTGVAGGRGGGGAGGGTGGGSGPSAWPSGGSPYASGASPASGPARSPASRRPVPGRRSGGLSDGAGAASSSVSVRSSGGSAGRSGRDRLGAGLVSVPAVPRTDPRSADPRVPEPKRFCSRSDCGAPVGRARGDRPGRTEGFCTRCGHPYSFVPELRAGDVVHGQYEVAGCLAHGGLGWVYLAVDRAVSDRWVVLKGLLDTGDQDAVAAAMSERRFLAEIEHPNIVRVYNFVEHLDQRTGSLDGYIVMEYVGGKSLKDIANERRGPDGRRDPLPVEQACAYGIEALEALAHLHSRNLLYCDFKVDNAIQTDDRLKLIDMGAVRRMDDDESAVYGTVGYQAPEVPGAGPSIASDLYTVARALAVLTFDFQGCTNVFAHSLPDPRNIEVFQRYASFHRLLVRATDPDPARRFGSAREMAEQLTGVLREVVALTTGRPRPALSSLFGPEVRTTGTELFAGPPGEVSALGARKVPGGAGLLGRGRVARRKNGSATGSPAAAGSGGALGTGAVPGSGGPVRAGAPGPRTASGAGPGATAPGPALPVAPLPAPFDTHAGALALPVPRVDPGDPGAGFLAGLPAAAPAELVAALRTAPVSSPELRLREVRAHLELGDPVRALETLAERYPGDWRVVWYRGVVSLATGDHHRAALSFDAVHDAFPGEPAPKLALGVCAEVLGRTGDAAGYYRLVWKTDPGHVSAAFGLARVRLAAGDRAGAVRVLESVPEASVHWTAARVAAVRARLRGRHGHEPLLDDLTAAAGQVAALRRAGLDAVRGARLTAEVLGKALDWVLSGSPGARPEQARLLGSELDERGLRLGLERSYRVLARLAERGEERIDLVERANRLRPRTWV